MIRKNLSHFEKNYHFSLPMKEISKIVAKNLERI